MKIAVTTSSFAKFSEEPLRLLREKGHDVLLNPHGRALTEDEALEFLQGCSGVVAGTEPLTRRVIEGLPELKVISRAGVGMDSVDLDAAKERGIAVRSTPDAPTKAVVELTLGFALDLLRRISHMDREMREGVWKKRMGNLLHGKRVGVIGFGRIGRAVAEVFGLMGCEVAFFDPMVSQDASGCFPSKSKEDLVRWADIVTLHCAKPKDGSLVMGPYEIDAMRRGALLLNAARGGIVDEAALETALREGRLGGAALDVFGKEPYTGPLLRLPNVVLTPHIGSYAEESRIRMETEAVQNLLSALG